MIISTCLKDLTFENEVLNFMGNIRPATTCGFIIFVIMLCMFFTDADAKNISKRYKTTCSSNDEMLCVQTRKDCTDIVQPDIQVSRCSLPIYVLN